ncbi:MAG: type IV toxin-antitoxin system AbiEi family antitoxin domain-containing protein [Halofilum sp. (in: g-proteobacteria)]|nr:type IV toxin-antitoxin system AbiEi family antitoxin domain-containing protein [Halofilum sp. (in: g-proteobacteria)]
MSERSEHVLGLARRHGILRPSDLDPYGIPRKYVYRLERAGRLQRVGRGLYVLPGTQPGEHRSLAEAAKRVPSGVICLLSALRFHELTTQAPFEVWMAIGEKAWRPRIDHPPLRIVRFSGVALREGIEEHTFEGVPARVFSPAKTVADCFKYRNKIGLDVALEALRECRRRRDCSMDALWHHAGICRVRNVMRPYLEALSA